MIPMRPRYANTPLTAEFVIREQLVEGLVEAAQDPGQLDELVARFDNLLQGSQQQMPIDWRAMLVDYLNPASSNVLRVILGYPPADITLPVVAIGMVGEVEDPTSASLADGLVVLNEKLGDITTNPDGFRIIQHHVRGVDHVTTLEISVWHTAMEGAILLQEAVRYVLFRRKGALTSAGIRNLQMTLNSLQPDDTMPNVAMVPRIMVTLTYQARQTVSEDPVPHKMTHTFTFS